MPFVSGFLKIRPNNGEAPDNELPGGFPGTPDNSLPGNQPYPDQGLPKPPPGVWPPPVPAHPIVIAPPGTPPGTIWPGAARPDNSLPGGHPGHPDQGLPDEQPGPDNTLPGANVIWVLVIVPGYGWNYVAVDPALRPTPV